MTNDRPTPTRTPLARLAMLGLLVPALTLGAVALAESAPATAVAADEQPLVRWSNDIWRSAISGDERRVEERLSTVPDAEVVSSGLEVFQSVYARRLTNLERAETDRAEARAEAMGEFEEYLVARDLSQSLRSAVEVQTLSPDMDAVLGDERFRELVAWADREVPRLEADGDWLHAQEILYRLRTLYEDTSFQDLYSSYDEHLEWVNQRVALLARYAPSKLHELQNKQALRLEEEALDPFDPDDVIDWQERLDGVTATMVRSALRLAAREHIESDGYRPLVRGGLESLKIIATTGDLAETFPRLGDERSVERWVSFIDGELRHVATARDRDLDSLYLSRLLDRIIRLNDDTLRLPEKIIYREFGDGAMNDLDRFSEIVWPDRLRRFSQAVEGNFIGVGILIRENDKREIMVVNPLEGSPAYFAGVKPDDIIAEVDGESTVGWTSNDAVDHITGEEGTTVTLGLRREGHEDLVRIPIRRDVIKLRSVKGWEKLGLDPDGEPLWNWYVDDVNDIAYIRLTQFTEDSYGDLLEAWAEMNDGGRSPRGLVFDLRYNPGGLLDAAVQISNLFLEGGPIVSGEDKSGRRVWQLGAERTRAHWSDVPTVVLVNKGSASASEIVAGALQAHGAAVIVGERSFGKGSVQSVRPVADNARLKITTQYFRLPAGPGETQGRLIHKKAGAIEWGVDPDIHVMMTPQQVVDSITVQREADVLPLDVDGQVDPDSEDRTDINRLLTEGLDPQLEMALMILQARAIGDLVAAAQTASIN